MTGYLINKKRAGNRSKISSRLPVTLVLTCMIILLNHIMSYIDVYKFFAILCNIDAILKLLRY